MIVSILKKTLSYKQRHEYNEYVYIYEVNTISHSYNQGQLRHH